MGQTNSRRISHTIENLPNTWRGDDLNQILNDINEEEAGSGYSEVSYLGATPFVTSITTWDDNTKTKKRTKVDFTYAPLPFVTGITKEFYAEDNDTLVIALITAVVNYNANKTVNFVDVVLTRP